MVFMFGLGISLLKVASDSGVEGAAAVGGAMAAMWAAMMGMFWIFYCFAMLLGLASVVLWVWALVDCLTRKDYESDNEKLLWALVILFAGIIGAALYYFLVKRKKEMEKK